MSKGTLDPWTLALRMLFHLAAVSLLAAACASSAADRSAETEAATATVAIATVNPVATEQPRPAPTSVPESTVVPTRVPDPPIDPPVFDQALLDEVADGVEVDDGTFFFAVIDADGAITSVSNGTDASGESPTADVVYPIGSFTKVFTAIATLTLVEEGRVDLDSPASDYVRRVPVPFDVTVRDLLQHTSGIYNYTDSPDLVAAAFEDPGRRWTPEGVHEFVNDIPQGIPAGFRHSYSNTNYLILGLLIEEITGQPYHQVVRDRITDPLAMGSTYLAGFEAGPAPFDPFEYEGIGDYDMTSIATNSWAAGAMVSSAADLHLLFGALFDGEIISQALVAQMTRGADLDSGVGVAGHGLGFDLTYAPGGFFGHSGGIPGHSVLIHHAPDAGVTAFLATSDSRLFSPADTEDTASSRFLAMSDALLTLIEP